MVCSRCSALEAEFERRERAYAFAYGVLTSCVGITRAFEYNNLKATADEARIDLEIATRELERHKRVHAVAT
jgi:GH24 family phage-related lysozyme (muramidase)